MKFRKSKQREKILEVLKNTNCHPTADWVYDQVKKEFPNLSLGTVYRNLKILRQQGKIKKIEHGSTYDRFDVVTNEHYHFICEKCGQIIDFKLEINKEMIDKIEEQLNCTTTRQK